VIYNLLRNNAFYFGKSGKYNYLIRQWKQTKYGSYKPRRKRREREASFYAVRKEEVLQTFFQKSCLSLSITEKSG